MQDVARRVLAKQQAAAATATPAGPRVIAHDGRHAQGRRMARNLGHGMLRPDVGALVQRTGEPQYCGTITGRAFDVIEAPSRFDPARLSRRFVGQFLTVDHKGTVSQGTECFVPPHVERAMIAALKQGNPEGVPVSVEVWCEPDQEGRPKSPRGYSYVTFDRTQQRPNDPVLALAYEAGILERPALALTAPEPEGEVDPETGEIGAAEPAEAAD